MYFSTNGASGGGSGAGVSAAQVAAIMKTNSALFSTNIYIVTSLGTVRAVYARNITNAVLAAQSGDTVVLPAGQFNEFAPIDIPHGVNLMGQGIGVTIITNSITDKAAMVPGSGSVVSGFSFYQGINSRNAFQYGFGTGGTLTQQKFFTNALLHSVFWYGETDCVFLKNAGYSTLSVKNCKFWSRWDWSVSDGTNTLTIDDCDVEVDNIKSDYASFVGAGGWSWLANGCVVGRRGKIIMSNVRGKLTAPPFDYLGSGATPEIRIVSAGTDNNGTIEMFNCSWDCTSPSSVQDLGFLFPMPGITTPEYIALGIVANPDGIFDVSPPTNTVFINVSVGFSNRWVNYTMSSTNYSWAADSYFTNVFGSYGTTKGVLNYGQSVTNRP